MTEEYHRKKLEDLAICNIEKILDDNETNKANLDYIAMMTEVEIPESEVE